MSWQDAEIEKRLSEKDDELLKNKARAERAKLKHKKVHEFISKLKEANDMLNPILRVSDNYLSLLELRFEASFPNYLETHIRYDINDKCLYLVESKFKSSGFRRFTNMERHDFIHFRVNEQNMDNFIDTILRNLCQKKTITNNLPGYTMTITYSDKYERLVKD